MICQVAIIDYENNVKNIIAVDSENINSDFLNPIIQLQGNKSWVDLRDQPYPFDWQEVQCTWNSETSSWTYPDDWTGIAPNLFVDTEYIPE
jgi:hypothetical protein